MNEKILSDALPRGGGKNTRCRWAEVDDRTDPEGTEPHQGTIPLFRTTVHCKAPGCLSGKKPFRPQGAPAVFGGLLLPHDERCFHLLFQRKVARDDVVRVCRPSWLGVMHSHWARYAKPAIIGIIDPPTHVDIFQCRHFLKFLDQGAVLDTFVFVGVDIRAVFTGR